ncbi:hypothetical protein A3I95_02435 [Candidatus Nomurabacteria bacterium RIFCSPLOWO2_02_FULL_44_12]|uniref:DNA polymerase III subunit delta n=1 Tax=Candidatus Nomurabacteria bacterium RIFCSPLOWO2_12_FULL_44_11 TaxID=1801796 RepID=A0A1F6Y7X7_9BACT|nr:MAG: hypothetical protein A3E95_00625 [Candidatus Nomurabacteria bacterium RIFCSPHIGHO2_12_FULL_44_22b]OGJ02442.1 MAG: hypothetical protein A3G53_03475 [Candidatus Nomurabacteria bacterium RIFCSPLOWO2_12_FULL_44_11]OGJ07023.1 MAG: hypothetical protein A3I95_02435 [Candidatus Nomurabacteria bacterium RIFCSPLOWO2_02_FULL_44_12]
MISKYFDKNNLHHAYLIEGAREEVVPEILEVVGELGVKTLGNPDFVQITLDSFKIEDARNLKAFSQEKANTTSRKIFLISANNFLLEAQNTLLKMFEEPIENTHFFLIVPNASALLKIFASRFYIIKTKEGVELTQAEEFVRMSLSKRIDFIKELLVDDEEENPILDSTRSRALKFLNEVEYVLHKEEISRATLHTFKQIFKVREFLRMPGSSTKSLMESVALVITVL